jgi:FkbM family methyltransferase
MLIRSGRSIPVEHPWPRRILRTVRFGLARIRNPGGYIEARAAPFDLKFLGPSADCITRHIFRLGAHEPDISRYIIEHIHLGPQDIAIDVGANIGWYTALLSRLSEPGAQIFAFEPDPETYRLLCGNLRANSIIGVTALNLALGETSGTAVLHRYKASNNGRHTLSAGSDGGGGACQVNVETLDSFCSSRGLENSRIRFLKIDVEGFEYYVLRGATNLLRRCDCILLEFNRGETGDKVLQLLAEIGLTMRAFVDGNPVPMTVSEILQSPVQLDLLLTPGRSLG